MPKDWRRKIALLFFAVQLCLVVQARFVDTRYFCWAPHTTQVRYQLEVELDGEELTGKQIRRRYRLKGFDARTSVGWEAHSIANLKAMLAQHQRTYGRGEDAKVTLSYRVNGSPSQAWTTLVWRAPTE